jgi:hypothetical protein
MEIARSLSSIDREIGSVKERADFIRRRTNEVRIPDPVKVLDLHEGAHPILKLTGEYDLQKTREIIREQPSEISKKLNDYCQNIAINPITIQKEQQLSTEEKQKLAEIRVVTCDTISKVLKCVPIEGVKLEGFTLIKQDGNIYDLESEVQSDGSSKKIRVRSKVTILPDGSVTVHQIDDHPSSICDKVNRRIAGIIDIALNKVYEKEFMVTSQRRQITGTTYVGKEKIVVGREICG